MREADVNRKGAIPFDSFGPGLFMLSPSILSISLFRGIQCENEPSSRGHPGRMVLPHPRSPPDRRPRYAIRCHLHVRVCLALITIQWAPSACHVLEVGFVFDTLVNGTEPLRGNDLHNSSLTPCMRLGWRLPPVEIPVGRSMI